MQIEFHQTPADDIKFASQVVGVTTKYVRKVASGTYDKDNPTTTQTRILMLLNCLRAYRSLLVKEFQEDAPGMTG